MNTNITILDIYEKRQDFVRDRAYRTTKTILGISFVLMLITFAFQMYKDPTPLDKLTIFTHAELSFSYITTAVLTLIFNYVIWVFSVATFVFSPLIVSIIYQASKEYSIKGGKGIKLLQVASSLFLPAFLFAILWMNYGQNNKEILMIPATNDIAEIVMWSLIVTSILWVTTKFIPIQYAELRLTVISSLLYSALFFMYSMGYSIIAMSILIGIIIFLMFQTKEIEKLANILILYDLEQNVAKNIMASSSKRKEQEASKEELAVKIIDLNLERELIDHDADEQQVRNDKRLAEQISAIQTEKLNLNEMANQARLTYLQKKYEVINDMYSILEKERTDKIETEIPKKIRMLREEAKNFTPEQLSNQMDLLIGEMNFGGDYMPKALEKLQVEMDELTNKISSSPVFLESDSKESTVTSKLGVTSNNIVDELTKISGVGPKISQLLNSYNIYTYSELSEYDTDSLLILLKKDGMIIGINKINEWKIEAELYKN